MRSHGAIEPLAPISPNRVALNKRYARASYTKSNAIGIENTMDGFAPDDITIDSHASNLTSLDEQTTDDFGKLLLQHARDERRLQDALQGRVRPFSRARPRHRDRLTLADLERSLIDKEASFEQRRKERETNSFLSLGSPPASSAGSSASVDGDERGSEPSLNIPKGWGRKARKGTEWLRRSLERREEVLQDEDVIVHRTTGFTGDGTPRAIDWANAASDVPLPTTEDSPSVQRYAKGTPPSVARRNETAAGKRGPWDIDEEFTGMSIITSTPALSRNTRLDDIKRRELETLTEISDFNFQSEEPPKRVTSPVQGSLSRSAERKRLRKSQQPGASWSHPAEQQLQLPKREARTEQDGSSPVVVYTESETPKELRLKQEEHKRTDSHDLLRRLARAASDSPKPIKSAAGPDDTKSQPSDKATAMASKQSSTGSQSANGLPVINKTPEEAHPVSVPASAEQPEDDAFDPRTPMPDELFGSDREVVSGYAKTPVVTGAWVDTPAPATMKRVSLSPHKSRFSPQKDRSVRPGPSQSPVKSPGKRQGILANQDMPPQPQLEQPKLPPSALAAVLDDARFHPNIDPDTEAVSYDQELQNFGESTINSLEDLVDTSLAPTSADNSMTLDLPDLPLSDAKPRSAAERQRWKEIEQVARMNKQLKDARHSIRDARVGLRRFENAMLSPEKADKAQQHGSSEGCDSCGCPGGTPTALDLRAIGQSLKRVFIVPRDVTTPTPTTTTASIKKHLWPFRWRLTWVGLIITFILSYTLLETALCAQYCQPRYARYMIGTGVDIYAPRSPFVIPTLMARPFNPVLKPAYHSLKTNGIKALRAYGILPEPTTKVYPWMRGRPTLSPKEQKEWDEMLAAAKRDAQPEITRWVSRINAVLDHPATTAVTWAQTTATAAWAGDDEVVGVGDDEVL